MAVQTTCPFCSRRYELDDALYGRKVRCRSCNRNFRARHGTGELIVVKPPASTPPATSPSATASTVKPALPVKPAAPAPPVRPQPVPSAKPEFVRQPAKPPPALPSAVPVSSLLPGKPSDQLLERYENRLVFQSVALSLLNDPEAHQVEFQCPGAWSDSIAVDDDFLEQDDEGIVAPKPASQSSGQWRDDFFPAENFPADDSPELPALESAQAEHHSFAPAKGYEAVGQVHSRPDRSWLVVALPVVAVLVAVLALSGFFAARYLLGRHPTHVAKTVEDAAAAGTRTTPARPPRVSSNSSGEPRPLTNDGLAAMRARQAEREREQEASRKLAELAANSAFASPSRTLTPPAAPEPLGVEITPSAGIDPAQLPSSGPYRGTGDPGHAANTSDLAKGTLVWIRWGSSWYPSHVIEVQGEGFLVHYEGYTDTWDELKSVDQLRLRDSTAPDSAAWFGPPAMGGTGRLPGTMPVAGEVGQA